MFAHNQANASQEYPQPTRTTVHPFTHFSAYVGRRFVDGTAVALPGKMSRYLLLTLRLSAYTLNHFQKEMA